jgi:hypothetical protein
MPRNYKRVQPGVRSTNEYGGVKRNTREYNGVVEFSSVQLEVRIVPVECPFGRK